MYCIYITPIPLDIYFDLCHRCADVVKMSLLRTPLALTRWTWSRSSSNMVNYQNFCSLQAIGGTSGKGRPRCLNDHHRNSLISRSCTSNAKTAGGSDLNDAKQKATKPPEIKSMPSGLTNLVTKNTDDRWPSLQNISLLALRFK